MLVVDMNNHAAQITMKEFVAAGRRYVSNPNAFASFMSGLKPSFDLLLDHRLGGPGQSGNRFTFFHVVMHELLPAHYDVRHLQALGGRFCLRLTAIGDYTVIALNRRVVTVRGLPADPVTGQQIVDAEVCADAFRALCNDVVVQLCERTLRLLGGDAGSLAAAH
jgi:hypothetical protein